MVEIIIDGMPLEQLAFLEHTADDNRLKVLLQKISLVVAFAESDPRFDELIAMYNYKPHQFDKWLLGFNQHSIEIDPTILAKIITARIRHKMKSLGFKIYERSCEL